VRHWFAAILLLAPLGLTAQVSSVAAKPAGAATVKTWTPPRTLDGQPDLQGTWTNASNVPLERPAGLGAKEFYTPEEATAKAKAGFQGDRPVTVEAHYDLSQFGLDPSQGKFAPNLRTSLIIGPEGRVPPQTPEARARIAANAAKAKGHEFDAAENRPLSERCILWPNQGPPMLQSGYNSNLQIFEGAGYVAILQEMIHDVRMIPTDGRPHLPANIRQWRGDSRGHWEGNTLVVDTTNFTNRTAFRGSTESLHVIERFTRTAEDIILYEFTLEDPATWTKPWTVQMPLAKAPGRIFEYACHEGNYGMANTLSEARALEAEKKAGK
jgi:hypothetical protein